MTMMAKMAMHNFEEGKEKKCGLHACEKFRWMLMLNNFSLCFAVQKLAILYLYLWVEKGFSMKIILLYTKITTCPSNGVGMYILFSLFCSLIFYCCEQSKAPKRENVWSFLILILIRRKNEFFLEVNSQTKLSSKAKFSSSHPNPNLIINKIKWVKKEASFLLYRALAACFALDLTSPFLDGMKSASISECRFYAQLDLTPKLKFQQLTIKIDSFSLGLGVFVHVMP